MVKYSIPSPEKKVVGARRDDTDVTGADCRVTLINREGSLSFHDESDLEFIFMRVERVFPGGKDVVIKQMCDDNKRRHPQGIILFRYKIFNPHSTLISSLHRVLQRLSVVHNSLSSQYKAK
ncbi:MAG: hypothetical protein LUF00_02320 [Lachnospiraceae bacterium]|nr:hypothetical protein [Lachnospiraceae bacterium]